MHTAVVPRARAQLPSVPNALFTFSPSTYTPSEARFRSGDGGVKYAICDERSLVLTCQTTLLQVATCN